MPFCPFFQKPALLKGVKVCGNGVSQCAVMQRNQRSWRCTQCSLSPGFFATETNARMVASPNGEKHRERTPAKRWADPREIAGAAIFLASPAASYVNGHTLIVDGGVSATYLS